jgi:hypothetical protein
MINFTVEQITRVSKEYSELKSALYTLAKILYPLGYGDFSKFGKGWHWLVYEIGDVDQISKTVEVTYSEWNRGAEELVTVKIPILWLQLEDPREEIKFHMELAN